MRELLAAGKLDNIVELKNDLDFSGMTNFLPIGQRTAGIADDIIPFNKTFRGNGHTIRNLVMKYPHKPGSDAGFFYALQGATVSNLRFDKSCSFSGAWAGSLAVKVIQTETTTTITNVTNSGTVIGGAIAGGIIGSSECNTTNPRILEIENCNNDGNISVMNEGDEELTFCSSGGILGIVRCTTTITGCSNSGGIHAEFNNGRHNWTDTNAGGIVGQLRNPERGRSTAIESCKNFGSVYASIPSNVTKNNVTGSSGGIVGSSYTKIKAIISVKECYNYGSIKTFSAGNETSVFASGIFGSVNVNLSSEVSITSCNNSGNINASSRSIGLIMSSGVVLSDTRSEFENINIDGCIDNGGTISSDKQSYGIVNVAKNIKKTMNAGIVNGACESYCIAKSYTTKEKTECYGTVANACTDNDFFNCYNSGICGEYGGCMRDPIDGYNELIVQENYCYEMICKKEKWTIQKRDDAKNWENRSTSCLIFKCDNESGFITTNDCNGKTVEIVFDDEHEINEDEVLSVVCSVVGINPDELIVKCGVNHENSNRCFILTDDGSIANDIASSIQRCIS